MTRESLLHRSVESNAHERCLCLTLHHIVCNDDLQCPVLIMNQHPLVKVSDYRTQSYTNARVPHLRIVSSKWEIPPTSSKETGTFPRDPIPRLLPNGFPLSTENIRKDADQAVGTNVPQNIYALRKIRRSGSQLKVPALPEEKIDAIFKVP